MNDLFDAIKAGDKPRVSALLDADPALVDAKDQNGLAAFTFAKYNRQDDIAKLLEARGARLDVFAAAMTGKTGRVTELLEGNRSLANLLSHDGWTPLHLAAFFGHKETAQALLAKGALVNARSTNAMENMPLHVAAAGRNAELVSLLLQHGANVNARQHGGWTALHAAAQSGDVAMLKVLLEGGADVKARAGNNQSALDLALTNGHREAVNLLEQHGASL